MALRRRARPPRMLRRLIVLGSSVTGITALRSCMIARNEKRFPELVADPTARQPA